MWAMFETKFEKAEKGLTKGPIVIDPECEREYAEHAALAAKLGVKVKAPVGTPLDTALVELGISVYDNNAVTAYLEKKAADRHNASQVIWRPLRRSDVDSARGLSAAKFDVHLEVYDKAVPLPVLQTVDQIAEKLGPGAVAFFVGEIKDDPFLAVCLRSDATRWKIVERWDEPGFRGLKS